MNNNTFLPAAAIQALKMSQEEVLTSSDPIIRNLGKNLAHKMKVYGAELGYQQWKELITKYSERKYWAVTNIDENDSTGSYLDHLDDCDPLGD